MLLGTFRRGSGMIGFGGWGAPVTAGPELDGPLSRAFGAGLGTGTPCANEVVTAAAIDAVMTNTPVRRALRSAKRAADRVRDVPVNASSCVVGRPFSLLWPRSGYRFCVKCDGRRSGRW